MNKKRYYIKNILLILVILFNLSIISAATIWTTDMYGNSKTDFSPEEIVYINGKYFEKNALAITTVTRPDGAISSGLSLTDLNGKFVYAYILDGIVGNYNIISSDGTNIATVNFTDAAIWTTKNYCGNSSQDSNQYNIGETVYIGGNGFVEGNYSWEIRGNPGGSSCDPNQVVASGIKNVNSSGNFCINAYTVQIGDCGVYQVKFCNKGDNYRVLNGSGCSTNLDCGLPSSALSCTGNNITNTTITPACSGGVCTNTTLVTNIKNCGNPSSRLICNGNDSVNVTIIPQCIIGGCQNNTSYNILENCKYGCTNGICNSCTPNCRGKECGDDGCGGSCGTCNFNEICNPGGDCIEICQNECSPISDKRCNKNILQTCGNFDSDPCLEWNADQICIYGCDSLNKVCKPCPDQDKDGVCDENDLCQDTKPGEEVDQNGCSQIQFCKKQAICGISCDNADWKNDERLIDPHDCMTAIIDIEGIPRPMCVAIEWICTN